MIVEDHAVRRRTISFSFEPVKNSVLPLTILPSGQFEDGSATNASGEAGAEVAYVFGS